MYKHQMLVSWDFTRESPSTLITICIIQALMWTLVINELCVSAFMHLCNKLHVVSTVALKYTLSRFEVVDDSTELSSIQLSSARFN